MANFMTQIDKKRRFELSQINNEECLLVEFVNNNHSLGIGFAAWLDKADISRIDEIILLREEVSILWPACDTQSANLLRPKLKKVNYVKHAVIILSHGEWTSMKSEMENKIKYDRLNISLSNRKSIKKRKLEEDLTNAIPKAKKIKKKSVQRLQNEQLLANDIHQEVLVNLNGIDDRTNVKKHSEKHALKYSEKHALKPKNNKSKCNPIDTLYDSNDSSAESAKQNISRSNPKGSTSEKIAAYDDTENIDSEDGSSSLVNLNGINDRNNVKKYSEKHALKPKKKKNKCNPIETLYDSSDSSAESVKQNISRSNPKGSTSEKIGAHGDTENFDSEDELTNSNKSFKNEKGKSNQVLSELYDQRSLLPTAYLPDLESYDNDDREVKENGNVERKKNKMKDTKLTEKRQKKPVSYTAHELALETQDGMPDLPLSKLILQSLPKTDVKKFTAALVTNVFTTLELKTHSVTGEPPNSNPHMKVAPELPPLRKQYIYDTVQKIFGVSTSIKGKINKILSNKISAARR